MWTKKKITVLHLGCATERKEVLHLESQLGGKNVTPTNSLCFSGAFHFLADFGERTYSTRRIGSSFVENGNLITSSGMVFAS